MIQVSNITKKFGSKTVVNNLNFKIQEGVVTGFLGPNGAGKTTTMRMILGLVSPTSGNVLIDGKAYNELENPLNKIGTMVDAIAADTQFTPRQHLTILATASNINIKKVDEVLLLVGLKEVSNKRISEFSFGMKQRVHIASALLGNPETIMMDEPFNGLDVEGIHWLRNLLKDLAKQGKAVLVSSHLLSEVEEIADQVIIIAEGKLITDISMKELRQKSLSSFVQVQSDNNLKLSRLLVENGAHVMTSKGDILHVTQLTSKQIGCIAFTNGISIYELCLHQPTLEQLFSELIKDKTEYKGLNISTESEDM